MKQMKTNIMTDYDKICGNSDYLDLTKHNLKKLRRMVKICEIVLPWYFNFASNILIFDQISKKQLVILDNFNFKTAKKESMDKIMFNYYDFDLADEIYCMGDW